MIKNVLALLFLGLTGAGCAAPYFQYSKVTALPDEYMRTSFYNDMVRSAEGCGFVSISRGELNKSAIPAIEALEKNTFGNIFSVGLLGNRPAGKLVYVETDRSRTINEGPSPEALEAFECVRQDLRKRYVGVF